MPEKCERLMLDARFSFEEFGRITSGYIARDMDDKWDLYFEHPWLYFCRSWTGNCTYQVRFEIESEQAKIAEAWVNRDPDQYKLSDSEFDRKFLIWLLETKLLDKKSQMPLPPST
jgi:hypothetical protein